MNECVIALDVGGTSMKGALLDREMRSLETIRRQTPRAEGPEAVVDAIASALDTLAGRAAAGGLTVRRAGVVVPGIVDERRARAVYSANLGWRDLPLADLLETRTGLPVTLGHDVRAGGYAESVLGAARDARDVFFVAIGTGISGALIHDGVPVTSGGYAGEIGHVVVDPEGPGCACGGRGCLEALASATSIATRFSARSGRVVGGAQEVAALLGAGDRDARAVWDEATEAFAAAFATAATLLAPELIVLGGGLSEAGDLLTVRIRARLAERLTFQRRPAIVGAELGDRAGCLGAGLYAWHTADAAPPSPAAGARAQS